MIRLSIVSTLYLSSPYIAEFHRRVSAAASKLVGQDYEIVFVNDGSPDDSFDLVTKLTTTDKHVVLVDLSRNFGHHIAIVAGLSYAKGEIVFLIDCDLEEQPEWLPLFSEALDRFNVDVVFGVQQKRVRSKLSNFCGSLFWILLNTASRVHIPHNPMTCRLMKRTYVNALLTMGDKILFLAGVFAWTGFKHHPLYLIKASRPPQHQSTYKLYKKLLHAVNSFSSFSVAPLWLVFWLGVLISASSFVLAMYVLIEKLLNPDTILLGFTSLMLSIWFLSGSIIISIGIIGLYLSNIFQEVKQRPLFITKQVIYGNER
jgi:putative glycosyltransferase